MKGVEKANQELQVEKRAAAFFVMGVAVTEDLAGDVTTKQAWVAVTTPTGEEAYRITLKYYTLVNQQTQAKVRSRWIVTEVEKIPRGDTGS